MSTVVIGMNPHKRTATIEVMASNVAVVGGGRYATDAHSVALAATRVAGLRPVVADQQLMVLRILADRRRSLGEDHIRMICQPHQLLLELIPGGAKKSLSAAQGAACQGPPARCGRPGTPAGGG